MFMLFWLFAPTRSPKNILTGDPSPKGKFMPNKKRVLCVDDSTDTCALVIETLKGWKVSAEHSIIEGLRRATIERFDLILLDYHLPDGNGLDLCRQIRSFDAGTPILMSPSPTRWIMTRFWPRAVRE
jgi:DNA-binding NtrC family response regulator